jgi:hypothetical protein
VATFLDSVIEKEDFWTLQDIYIPQLIHISSVRGMELVGADYIRLQAFITDALV